MRRRFPVRVALAALVALSSCSGAFWKELRGQSPARFGVLAHGLLWIRAGESVPSNLHEVIVVQYVATGWARHVALVPIPSPPVEHGWVASYAVASSGEAERELEIAQLDVSKEVRIAHCKRGDYGVSVDVWEEEENSQSPLWQAYFALESSDLLICPKA